MIPEEFKKRKACLTLEIAVYDDGTFSKRISIPVDDTRIPDDFDEQVRQFNSPLLKVWLTASMALPEVEIHPPMSFDDDGVHREVKY